VLAQRAKSLLTPIIVTDEAPVSIVRRATGRTVAVGDFLMELAILGSSKDLNQDQAPSQHSTTLIVPLEHGLHARPAALLASRLKRLAATVHITAHGKSANARSAISIMSLGVRKGDSISISASGPDAAAAIAALKDAIGSVVDEGHSGQSAPRDPSPATVPGPSEDRNVIRGVMAAPGLAVGTAFQLSRQEIQVSESGNGVDMENQRLDTALAAVRATLRAAMSSEHGPGREVLAAHLEFLDDPELIVGTRETIAHGKSAGFAWRHCVRANVEILRSLTDPRMAERADDLLDLESRVLAALEGKGAEPSYALPNQPIVLANELLPSQFVALDATRLAGICTVGGGPTSHVAILAAALNIPMLVAAGPAIREIAVGTTLILDADHSELRISPAQEQRSAAETKVSRRRARDAAERTAAQRECRTADGARIEVLANVGSVAEARAAVTQGAEGCGLLRTEFLFLDRETAPDEATQSALYSGIVTAFAGRPVVVRTLDAGGDKPLAYMPLSAEDNPALGLRGVRISQVYPDVLRSQIRAILSAQPRGRCRILLPMISDPAEVRAIGAMLDAVRLELGHDEPVPLGAMIETPSAALLAEQIAREADFLSIGTNDLTQYTLAIDRGNPALAARLDSLHPAVLRLIASTARGGRANYRDVAVCGGLASDVAAAPILIGLGVNELSAVPAVIPRLKALIGTLNIDACEALAQRALEQETPAQVRALLEQTP